MPASFTSQVMAALGRLKLFATAALPPTAPPGLIVYDTTADAAKVVKNDGVTYATLGGGAAASIVIGNPVTGGAANQVLFEDGAQNLAGDADMTFVTDTLSITKVSMPAGTAAAVSIRMIPGSVNIGFHDRSSAGNWTFAVGGVDKLEISGSGTTSLLIDLAWGFDFGTVGTSFSAGIARVAGGVIRPTVGGGSGAANGWIQNASGELALNADYTNATAGFTATALSATVISGRTYDFECVLFFSDSTAADGAQFDFGGGAATVTNFRAQAFAVNNVGGALVLTNGAVTAINTAIQVALALTTQSMIVIKGTFVPSSSATFIVRAAQTAHTAGTLTVNRGSYLHIRDASPL